MSRFSYDEGVFSIEPLPSQPQVAHCHNFFVMSDRRGHGRGHALKERQMMTLRNLGYDFAICTVDSQNAAQKKVLSKAGWPRMAPFSNSKTGGQTEVWGCAIING